MKQAAERQAALKDRVGTDPKIAGESASHRRDEDLTKMRRLVLDAKEGRLAWAALAPGGFLGMAREVKSWT